MKYIVYAKFLGAYMPENKATINNCVILKNPNQYYLYLDDDRPIIPVGSKNDEFHCIRQGIKNYIYYSQNLISTRTFESEYLITTEVESYDESNALKIAHERFSTTAIIFSLVAKNKTIKLGNKRIKRKEEFYYFEIIGILIRREKQLIRVKLPKPSVGGHNFFPRKLPKDFLFKAKNYLKFNDQVFLKGLIYFQRATAMKESGVFSELEIILNFIKCIELICTSIGKDDYFGLSKKQFEKLYTKNIIVLAGKKIKIKNSIIKDAQNFWDIRNKRDIAHQDQYYNPYNLKSTNAMVNYWDLEATATEFLVKYYKYRKN